MPHHIRKVSRRMIKRGHTNARIMRRCDERIARSQACAHDPKIAIALLLEPIEAAPDIDDPLSHRIQCAPDIGRHSVICAADLRGHADIVIWHAQPKYCNSQHVEYSTKLDVRD